MVHVLLTNDDGPLNDETSPYVKFLVDAIQTETDWELSICVPHTQRSWIGKAHFAGQDLTASFIYPTHEGNAYQGPYPQPQPHLQKQYKEWALVDGTPASCADIGIHHLYKDSKGPVDLVISGPNFGRNTSAVYITSSGTVGAAMEASLSGKKAIGLSFGFETRKLNVEQTKEASKISVALIKHLYENWDDSVDVYSVNIPLNPKLKYGETKIHYVPILENRWNTLFERHDSNKSIEQEKETDIIDGSSADEIKFKWKPDFHAVHKSVVESESKGELNDGVILNRGEISVTPLKSIFKSLAITGEIKLPQGVKDFSNIESAGLVYLSIDQNSYIYPAIYQAIEKYLPNIRITNSRPETTTFKTFQYGDYEELDFDRIYSDDNYLINSYIYRKALIRKHYLAHTIHSYNVKNPRSILNTAFPETFNLEVDYAEFLEDSLDEAYELRTEIEQDDKTWILKPSMSDKGQGIRIFNTIDQLQEIFDSFEEGINTDDEDEEAEEGNDNHGVITSQLRHFVVQQYIDNPLLLPNYNNKKFHIRTYVLSSGSIEVFVFKKMLTLFALTKYSKPDVKDEKISMFGHLTNTCLQGEEEVLKNNSVVEFWELEGLLDEDKTKIFKQICSIVGDVFKAAVSVDKMNFQPLNNAFEIFGLDFIIDDQFNVTLLEINSYPDFKQTGDDLKELIYSLFDSVVKESVLPFFKDTKRKENELLVKVLDQSTNDW